MSSDSPVSLVLGDARCIVCVGPGGVGKTSIAASLALEAAHAGRRALVVTCDPARRLATALDRDLVPGQVDRVPLPAGVDGTLHATMIESADAFDGWVRAVAPDPQTAAAILSDPIYAAFSRNLARSHAYGTFAALQALLDDSRFDLVVLDTPPAQSALDLLDAPARLEAFMDDTVVRWLLPGRRTGLAARGRQMVEGVLGRLMGDALAGRMLGFFTTMAALRPQLLELASGARRTLIAAETRFVVVGRPPAIGPCLGLVSELATRDLSLGMVVLNRAHRPTCPNESARLTKIADESAQDELRVFRAGFEDANRENHMWVKRLQKATGARILAVPDLADPHDGLARLDRIRGAWSSVEPRDADESTSTGRGPQKK